MLAPPTVSLLTPVLARLRWHRRSIAAAIAVLALATLARSLAPAPAPTTRVLVAAHELAAGAQLSEGDLRIAAIAASAVPHGVLTESASPVGRVVALPVRRGEVMTDVRLLDPVLLAALDPGFVAAPVRLADDSAAAIVRAGDLVDVLAAGESAGEVTAAGARVLLAPTAGDEPVVVLAITGSAARSLARAAVTSRLSLVLRPD